MTRSRSRRTMALVAAMILGASALVLRPVAAAAQPLPRLPKMVWELYLQEEYKGCGVMYGLYARLPEADRARLHAGTKIPLDAGTLTRGQTEVVTAWFNSARWGCDPPAENLDANAVGDSTVVLKCEDRVVEFCLQSPEQGIWRKLTIACAPGREEWVRDGLPLLPARWGGYTTGWEGGTHPPVPPPDHSPYSYNHLRDLYSAYANLPTDVLRKLHQGTDVSLPIARLPGPVREGIVAAYDRETAMHNGIAGWPAETLRTPEMRRRHLGIATVDFTYRTDRDSGDANVLTIPRPHRVVYVQLHFSPWGIKEKFKYWVEFGDGGYAKYSPLYRVAMHAALQRHLCAWANESKEWHDRWLEEIPTDISHGHRVKPGAPPRPEPWP